VTPEQKEALRQVFPERPETSCQWCGGYHLRACPRVKRMTFMGQGAGTGNVTEVEYWHHNEVDWSEVIFPEEVFGD
jgi:hypothetical protein